MIALLSTFGSAEYIPSIVLATKIAGTVIKTKKSITLEPMPAYERKVIHTKLQENDRVKTHSVGE